MPATTFDHRDMAMDDNAALAYQKLLKITDHCDVTVICADGKGLACHRHYMAKHSSVFKTMFESNFVEGQPGKAVAVKSINFALFKKIVQFLYGGSIEISGQEVMPLQEFADMYDIQSLSKVCGKMLIKHVTPTVAMTVWKHGFVYQATDLMSKCHDYCVKNFSDGEYFTSHHKPQIAATNGFLESEPDLIMQLLSDFELKVPTENDVFSAILDWVVVDQKNRAVHLKEMLEKCIRIDNIGVKFVSFTMESLVNPPLNEQTTMTVLQFMRAITNDKVICPLLKPRENTEFVDSLDMYIYCTHSREIAVQCGWERRERSIQLDDDLTKLDRLYFINGNKYAVRQEGGSLGFLNEYLEWFDVHPDVSYDYHLIGLDGERMLHISYEDGGVILTRIPNIHEWLRNCYINHNNKTNLELSVKDLQLSTVYSNHLFMFVPKKSTVHVFDALRGLFLKSITLPGFSNDSSCAFIASKKNIACLVGEEFIYIIHLDRLLHQTPEPDTSGEPATSVRCDQMKRVRVPAVTFDIGGQLVAASIHGQNLYITEQNMGASLRNQHCVINLYSIDLNILLGLVDGTAIWKMKELAAEHATQTAHLSEYCLKLQLFPARHQVLQH